MKRLLSLLVTTALGMGVSAAHAGDPIPQRSHWTFCCGAQAKELAANADAAANTEIAAMPSLATLGDPTFFPLAVWWQNPFDAPLAKAENLNIMLGFGQGVASWPQRFGSDNGELAAVKAAGMYAIGGIYVPYSQNTSAQSVASIIALANNIGAQETLLGYNAGDEPDVPLMAAMPAAIAAMTAFDPTRKVWWNHSHWMEAPAFCGCQPTAGIALRAVNGAASTDFYPMIDIYIAGTPNVPASNFLDTPNDALFIQGIVTQSLVHFAAPGQPVWVFVESGSNSMGSMGNNVFSARVTAGSATIANVSGWSKFTALWQGLTVTGPDFPAGAKIISVQDATHATVSVVAKGTNPTEQLTLTGADDKGCFIAANLCLPNGNVYRPTPDQVAAEVWMSIINGANGIEYFCHDSTSSAYCLTDPVVKANLTKLNADIISLAPILNATTVGICSMQFQDYTYPGTWRVLPSCTNGVVTMKPGANGLPGAVLAKQSNGVTYVLAQSDRRGTINGGAFTFILTGAANKKATVIYDSAAQYAPSYSTMGKVYPLGGDSSWIDRLGQGAPYQTKIYEVQ